MFRWLYMEHKKDEAEEQRQQKVLSQNQQHPKKIQECRLENGLKTLNKLSFSPDPKTEYAGIDNAAFESEKL